MHEGSIRISVLGETDIARELKPRQCDHCIVAMAVQSQKQKQMACLFCVHRLFPHVYYQLEMLLSYKKINTIYNPLIYSRFYFVIYIPFYFFQ